MGTWIGSAFVVLLVAFTVTFVLFEVPSPADWLVPILSFLLVLGIGARRTIWRPPS